MENQTNSIAKLPQQIIDQITSKLCIKTMIKCMCVCKLWRTILCSTTNPNLLQDTHFLLYDNCFTKFAIHDPLQNSTTLKTFHSLEYGGSIFMREMYGSCNGLICFSGSFPFQGVENRDIYIYNPILGEYVVVPKPNLTYSSHTRKNTYDIYNFGFCHSTNQYKLARIACNYRKDEKIEVEIYTLGSGWRYVGEAPNRIRYYASTTCGRGAIFWLVRDHEKNQSIVSLDLTKEEFGSVAPPPIDEDEMIHKIRFLDHCLIATVGKTPSLLEIWMMKDFSVNKEPAWIKNWTICAKEVWGKNTFGIEMMVPIKLSSDGGIFMKYDDSMYCCDPKDNKCTPYRNKMHCWSLWSGRIRAFTPTLVSPKALMEDGSCKNRKL